MKALFIGRFQPFHKGHLASIKQISKQVEKIFLVIGSSQESGTIKNPFSFAERKEMLDRCLEGVCEYVVYGVNDMSDDSAWTKKVLETTGVGVEDTVVFTGNDWTKKCFTEAGLKVKSHDVFFDNLCATEIREKISKGEEWENLVPEEVLLFLQEIKGTKRIRSLFS
ncbi:MAG: nicotinamide-nucleotide adenylyltransferase [bacterium]